METENKNRSTINHPSSADDAASIDGPRDNLVNASDCSRDSKAVGNMMTHDTDGLASVLSSSCRCLPSLASVAKTKNPIEVSEYSGSELILSFISDPFGFAFKRKSDGQVLFIRAPNPKTHMANWCLRTSTSRYPPDCRKTPPFTGRELSAARDEALPERSIHPLHH
ncbi:hypothetical protein FF1_025756 [Malus domestica]